MSSRLVFAACGRFLLGLVLSSAALPLTAAHAQSTAARVLAGPAVAAPEKPQILNAQKHQQPAIDNDATPSGETAKAADEPAAPAALKAAAPQTPPEAEQKAEAQEPVRAATVTIAAKPEGRKKRVDYIAPGCSPGKLCIVCVAGCPERAGAIVHSAAPQATAD